jgi:hypothetical protein
MRKKKRGGNGRVPRLKAGGGGGVAQGVISSICVLSKLCPRTESHAQATRARVHESLRTIEDLLQATRVRV